jgi:carbon-monoxide dehydrogenase medium subunit
LPAPAVRVRGGEAVLTALGVSDRPVTRDATDLLRSTDRPRAAAALAAEMVDTAGDVHGSADYRRHLLAGLIIRELAAAAGAERT